MSFNYAVSQMLDDENIKNKAKVAYNELRAEWAQDIGCAPDSDIVIEVIFNAIKENLP